MTHPLRIPAPAEVTPLRVAVDALVRHCHQLGVLYATDDWSPLSDITLGLLLRRAGIQWRYCAVEHIGEIVWPPVCGIHLLQLNRSDSRLARCFALRHGLAHLLAGHVADLSYARDGHHWMTPEEQLADAFALADLIPRRAFLEAEASGFWGPDLERWTVAEVRKFAKGWPEGRIRDRAVTSRTVQRGEGP